MPKSLRAFPCLSRFEIDDLVGSFFCFEQERQFSGQQRTISQWRSRSGRQSFKDLSRRINWNGVRASLVFAWNTKILSRPATRLTISRLSLRVPSHDIVRWKITRRRIVNEIRFLLSLVDECRSILVFSRSWKFSSHGREFTRYSRLMFPRRLRWLPKHGWYKLHVIRNWKLRVIGIAEMTRCGH